MLHTTALVLFESTIANAVLQDPANQDWLAVVSAVEGELYGLIERRYYLALYHFRQQHKRPALPGVTKVYAEGKQQALQGVLSAMEERKAAEKGVSGRDEPAIFVDACPDQGDKSLPASLRDFSICPPPLRELVEGRGRPPIDALCMMRAFLAAPMLGVADSPTAVNALLRSNPTFAAACGFLGHTTQKVPGEWTSRQLPSLSKLEEFNEVMTRYGLWHLARTEQVAENLATGVVEMEDTLSFDTTHVIANSHCGNVVPADAKVEPGKKPKHRKAPRLRKTCSCGKERWETCAHPWVPTDQGAAIVVKGPTRIYWGHKASVAAYGKSEIPIDVRVLQYAAEYDGKTLVPHLRLLERGFPTAIAKLRHVLADDAYQRNREAVATFGMAALLTVPVHPNASSKAKVAARFAGIERFTPIGVPVCQGGHRFDMAGRDISKERYIWTAPNDAEGKSVCEGCPFASDCLQRGSRRHIRVDRADFPQIDWDHPQHLARNRTRYGTRTGVERAIKRLKVDLNGAHLTYRHSLRVQAQLDRKLHTLHLLLKVTDTG